MDDRIDLHTHSTVSDGTDTSVVLVRYAREKGLREIVLTDSKGSTGMRRSETI